MEELINEIRSLIAVIKTQNNESTKHLELYSVEEVAALMHISQNSVRNFIKAGAIKTFKYKGILRIRKIHLERFLNINTI